MKISGIVHTYMKIIVITINWPGSHDLLQVRLEPGAGPQGVLPWDVDHDLLNEYDQGLLFV